MNLHLEAAPIRGPVTGSARAELGGLRTPWGCSSAEDGEAVALTAWLRQDRGAGRGSELVARKGKAAPERRLRAVGRRSVQ